MRALQARESYPFRPSLQSKGERLVPGEHISFVAWSHADIVTPGSIAWQSVRPSNVPCIADRPRISPCGPVELWSCLSAYWRLLRLSLDHGQPMRKRQLNCIGTSGPTRREGPLKSSWRKRPLGAASCAL